MDRPSDRTIDESQANALVIGIGESRAAMTVTIQEIEERLSPGRMKEQFLEAFQEARVVIKRDLTQDFREAKSALADEIKSQLDQATTNAADGIKEQLSVAKVAVKQEVVEVKEAVLSEIDDARAAIRAATIGKVENMITKTEDTLKDFGRSVKKTGSNVGHSIADAGQTVGRAIVANPIPIGIAAFGLGWLVWNLTHASKNDSKGQSDSMAYSKSSDDGIDIEEIELDSVDTVRSNAMHMKDRSAELAGDAKEAVNKMAHRVQTTAGEMAHRVQTSAGEVAHRVQTTAGEFAKNAKKLEGKLEHSVQENPAVYGALAFALGSAVGASLPHSRVEDTYLGAASDRLVLQAEGAAHGAMDKMQRAT